MSNLDAVSAGSQPARQRAGNRVLALVTDAYGGYGGIAQNNRDFLDALARTSGVETIEVLVRHMPNDPEATPPNLRLNRAISGRLAYAAYAFLLALRLRPSIVFSGHLYHGPLSSLVARMTGA